MQSSCWVHPFCENFEVSKLYTPELQNVCKFFFKPNNWDTRLLWLMGEMPDYWKHERNVWVIYRRGQRQSLIAWSGGTKIEGLSWIKFCTRTHWKVWVRFWLLTKQNQTIRIPFVYWNFRMSTLETINITPWNKLVTTHLTDAPANSLSIYLKSFFVMWSSRQNSSKTGFTGSQNWLSRT